MGGLVAATTGRSRHSRPGSDQCGGYAEFSIGYARIEEVDSVLDDVGLKLVEAPRPALFLAGKAFQRYRAQGGSRTSVLPDFFIGAHAAVGGFLLLMRDARRYRAYFPGVELIAPDETD